MSLPQPVFIDCPLEHHTSQNTLLRQPFHLFVYRYSGSTGRKRHLNAISVRVISRIGVEDAPVNVFVFLLCVNGKPSRLDLFGIRLDLIDGDVLKKSGGKFIVGDRNDGKLETGLRNKPGEFVIRPVAPFPTFCRRAF